MMELIMGENGPEYKAMSPQAVAAEKARSEAFDLGEGKRLALKNAFNRAVEQATVMLFGGLDGAARAHHYDALTAFVTAANSGDIEVALILLQTRFVARNQAEIDLVNEVSQLFAPVQTLLAEMQ